MLRHPKAVSVLDDLATGAFREVIDDATIGDPNQVRRVILCSGQVYYDLAAARDERNLQNIAIARLEQIYPFPADPLRALLDRYPQTADVLWAQEEPRNMGPWRFVQEQLQPILDSDERVERMLHYAGRAASASPSAGSLKRHQQEQAELIEEAFAG